MAKIPDKHHYANPDEIITMYVAPGVSSGIRPEDIIRPADMSDEEYAEYQALMMKLWSIPDNAG